MVTDGFDFNIIDSFDGYITTKDKTNVGDRAMVRGSKNVYKKDSGTIANRFGLKRRGEADSTAQGVASSYEWNTSLGFTRVLRVLSDTSSGNGKLQVESNIADGSTYLWYDLQTGLSLTRYIFDSWWDNTLKKDKLLMARGDSNMYSWQGGIAKIVSSTINTITLDRAVATSGFDTASGSVLIGGVAYAYTGSSGNDLTGVTPDASGLTVGSVVLSSVVTHSNEPASGFTLDFLKVIGNRAHCCSYTSRIVYISSSTDFTDFTVPTPRTAGSPELLTLDNNPTAIAVRQGNAHISAGLSDWYVVSYVDIAVGSTLTQQTVVDKQQTAALSAAKAQEFIDTIGDDIVYVDQENQIRIYGIFRNITSAKYPSLSQQVRQELEFKDLTGGALRAVGDFIYLTIPLTGELYLQETRETIDSTGNVIAERLWHPPFIVSASRVALIDGVIYVYSTANPQMYQLWDTAQWQDDSPSGEALPYDSVVRFAYQQTERRQGMSSLDKVYVEGYMSNGTDLNAYILADYQGASGAANPNVNSVSSPATFFQGGNAPSLGDYSLGNNPLGDGLSEEENSQESLPKYRAILDVTPVNCFEYQVIFYSDVAGSRWEVLAWGTNAQITRNQQAGFLRKT